MQSTASNDSQHYASPEVALRELRSVLAHFNILSGRSLGAEDALRLCQIFAAKPRAVTERQLNTVLDHLCLSKESSIDEIVHHTLLEF